MGRKVLTLKNYSPEEIKSLFNADDKYKIGLRLYAVYQVAIGKPSRKLSDLYDTSFKQINNWVHRFDEGGLDGLRDKPGRGRKSRLSEEQRSRLAELIARESPQDYDYNTDTWTGPLLIDWIAKHFNIEYKKAQIYNIIKSLGFSYQKSRGIYPEADPEAQQAFKEDLKKTFRKSY
jgi:transposase